MGTSHIETHPDQRKFQKDVRDELKEKANFTCSSCKIQYQPEELEIHHNHIWKSEARRHQIPGSFVAHPVNGLPLCTSCHDKLHKKERERPIPLIVAGIIAIARQTEQGKIAARLIAQIKNRRRS